MGKQKTKPNQTNERTNKQREPHPRSGWLQNYGGRLKSQGDQSLPPSYSLPQTFSSRRLATPVYPEEARVLLPSLTRDTVRMWPRYKDTLRAWIIQYFHLGSPVHFSSPKLSGYQLPRFLYLPPLVGVTERLLEGQHRARAHVWASESTSMFPFSFVMLADLMNLSEPL